MTTQYQFGDFYGYSIQTLCDRFQEFEIPGALITEGEAFPQIHFSRIQATKDCV